MQMWKVLFLLFMIYAIIGWILEVIGQIINKKRFINRGFLIGPYCPIYGIGAILMTLFIPHTKDILGTFLKAVLICGILEYTTSYLMEKIFKTRWWDYSNKKFNINGRICLETLVLFGIGGVLAVDFISPYLFGILININPIVLNVITYLFLVIFVADVSVSYNIISCFKKVSSNIKKDSTEDITKLVRQVLKEKSYLYKRLVDSFPNFTSLVKNIKK